jgi:hypothetical protein
MTETITLEQFLGILLVALGGREGLAAIINKIKQKKESEAREEQDFVTDKLCRERHGSLEKLVDEVRKDVKELLKRTA